MLALLIFTAFIYYQTACLLISNTPTCSEARMCPSVREVFLKQRDSLTTWHSSSDQRLIHYRCQQISNAGNGMKVHHVNTEPQQNICTSAQRKK